MPQIDVEPKRILLVKPSALGDIVHALPVATLIKRKWPTSYLAWLVSRPFASLLETHPAIDEVLPWDRNRGASVAQHADAALDVSRLVRNGNFDLVIDLQGLLRSAWIAWQSGAKVRVGLAASREAAPLLYTHRVPTRPESQHAIDRYLDVAEALGCERDPVDYQLMTTPADELVVDALLKPLQGKKFAVLLPGTNWSTKRWPAKSFAELGLRLRRVLGLEIVVAGMSDAAEAAQLIDGLDVTTRTSVRELVALLRRAALVVCNDSGPMHLAAALSRPLVAPFGPTDPVRTGPYGRMEGVVRLEVVCSPCFSRACVHQTCLQSLSVEAVMRHCESVLAEA